MTRYLTASLRAQWRSGRMLALLSILGVALGVAAVLSIQIINRSALGAFQGTVRAISGTADLTVTGSTPFFPDSVYRTLIADRAVARAYPVVQVSVAMADSAGGFLDLYGLDLLQALELPVGARDTAAGAGDPLRTPGWVAVGRAFAQTRALAVGDSLMVTSGSRRVQLRVGALLDLEDLAPLASPNLAVMDIAQAHDRFAPDGGLSQVDLVLAEGSNREEAASRLAAALGAGYAVQQPEEREAQAASLLDAFRLNLTALSLISILVGLFLVYSALQASLVRRRTEFGLLRSLGASPRQVATQILGQAGATGTAGVILGLPLGWGLARLNLDSVSETISSLYLLPAVERLVVTPALVALGLAVGIGGAILAALPSALAVARESPTALLSPLTIHRQVKSRATPMLLTGLALLAATGVWYLAAGHTWRPAGFVLAAVLLAGLALVTPATVSGLTRPVVVRGFGPGFAARTLSAELQTTSVAVAALAVAVSLLVGITVMVESFRGTITDWVATTVRADVYLTTPSWARATALAPLDSAWLATVTGLPGVDRVDRLRAVPVMAGDRRIFLAGIDLSLPLADRFRFQAGNPATAEPRVRDGTAALISEPLSRRLGLGPGDTLRLERPGGVVVLPVAAVYYDYGNESGAAVVSLATLDRTFGAGPISNAALYLSPGTDPDAMVDLVRAQDPEAPVLVRSNRRLRAEVFRIFDQTFAITLGLRAMALLIAVAGITLTLLIQARERLASTALYRSLGATPGQIFRLFLGKGIAMTAMALVLGAGAGAILAVILTRVINRAWFGWTIALEWPIGPLAGQALLLLFATAAASVYPALRASRVSATDLSREA